MLTPHRPLRVAVLCSHRAPGLLYLLNQSPERGASFEIVCCLTTERTFEEEVRVERRGVPVCLHPMAAYYAAAGMESRADLALRAAYDARTLQIVERYLPDVLLLDGYLFLVTAPILERFRNRVLNLHFSDLTLRTATGAPRFPGIRAVRNALAAGAHETRATVHLVDALPDAGPPIVRSWPFPVSPLIEDLRTACAEHVFNAYAFAHEQWMMRTAAGPLVASALRLVSNGAVDLDALADASEPDTPWLLERHGFLLAPEVELAGVGRSSRQLQAATDDCRLFEHSEVGP
jgi:folate-dependent phosphoribosylglycinamide formyltransferase PurN